MSEVTFAKQFLATLDKRPIKLPADHVADPRKLPNQSPAILPRQTHPFPTRSRPTDAAQRQKTITATLKPMRGAETITLSDITLDTSIHDIKTQYAAQSGQSVDKIKLLLNKKPAADLKTLKELGVSGDSSNVELSVMLMGGAAGSVTPIAASEPAEKASPVPEADKMDVDSQGAAPLSEKAQAEVVEDEASAAGILKTEEFWADLKGFLAQRLRDQGEGEKLARVFREAYGKS